MRLVSVNSLGSTMFMQVIAVAVAVVMHLCMYILS